MIRSLVKTGGSHALHLMGIDRHIRKLKTVPVVLGYHRVVEDFTLSAKNSISPLLISRQEFEQHLDWLGRRFRFISLDELGATLERGDDFDTPVAAITFDDGYADVYHNAFPVLRQKGIPAAVFAVSDFIGGNTQPLMHDRLYWLLREAYSGWQSPRQGMAVLLRDLGASPVLIDSVIANAENPFATARELLARLPQEDMCWIADALEDQLRPAENPLSDSEPLSWHMLATMHHSGITIGSHTRSHVVLTNENPSRVHHELEWSRKDMEAMLGIPVRHFAYPDGRFNSRIVQAVAAAGYRYAYGTCSHRDPDHPLLTIPRRVLWEGSCKSALGSFSPAVMSCQIAGVFDLIGSCDQNHSDSVPAPAHKDAPVAEDTKVGFIS